MDYFNWVYGKLFGSDDSGIGDYAEGGYCTRRKVVAFGNVLIDRSVQLENDNLFKRHNLPIGSKGELSAEKLSQITAEAMEGSQSVSSPGGAALNTVRVLKYLGTDALFFGAIGSDAEANELRALLKERGIEARLETIDGARTGQCIALVYEDKPTLYANIGASAFFSVAHLKQSTLNDGDVACFLRPIERKQILYIEGFFVPAREAVCDYIATHYIRERRRLALNLSAQYIVEENSAQIIKLAHCAYFIFGNRNEFEALRKVLKCDTIEAAAMQLLQGGKTTKIICITKGADGAQIISNYVEEMTPDGEGEVTFQSYNAPRVENVVDPTGAGDAFVAGFLHAWLQKRSLSECVRVAADVAAKVVTQFGCNMPQ